MKRAIFILIFCSVIFIGLLFGHALVGQKGYVLISFGNYVIEMSVLSACLTLLGMLIVLRITERLFQVSWSTLLNSKRWLELFSYRRQERSFRTAINYQTTGELLLAKNSIEKTLNGEFAGSNFLIAANIEKQLGNNKQMLSMLETASTFKDSQIPANIAMAEWYNSESKFSEALSLLDSLPDKTPQTKRLALVWLSALKGAHEWTRFNEVLRANKKILGNEYTKLIQQRIQAEFAEITSKEGATALIDKWQGMSRNEKRDMTNQLVFLDLLIEEGMSEKAQTYLLHFCGKHPEPGYFSIFKKLSHTNSTHAVKAIESWIKDSPDDGELYSVLGHLAFNTRNYELAEKAICKAIDLRKEQADIKLYAELLVQKKDFEKAAYVFKELA